VGEGREGEVRKKEWMAGEGEKQGGGWVKGSVGVG